MVAAVDWVFQQRSISSSLSTSGTLHSSVCPYLYWPNNAPHHRTTWMSRSWNIVERVGANSKNMLLCDIQPTRTPLLNALDWDSHLRIIATPNAANMPRIGRAPGRSFRDVPGREALTNTLTRTTCGAPWTGILPPATLKLRRRPALD